MNVIFYRLRGTGCGEMPATARWLRCVYVVPTPSTHACAETARSDRRATAPRETDRTVAVVDGGPFGSFQAGVTNATPTATEVRRQLILRSCVRPRRTACRARSARRLIDPRRRLPGTARPR